jgi:SAM-dependent methyltransferase
MKLVFSRCREEKALSKHSMSASGLAALLDSRSFDEIYDRFGLTYFLSVDGDLSALPESSFDCIFSYDVLEHIPLDRVEKAIEEQSRLLKPGGYAIHNIGIGDHLTQYDRKESWKKYLEYSDTAWKLFFENKVQYINRLQGSDWLGIFERKGFELLEKRPDLIDIENLNIHKKYRQYSAEDLACKALTLVYRKAESSPRS